MDADLRTRHARTIVIHVPLTFRKRNGRKQIIAPDGLPITLSTAPRIDNALIKALARAHRWKRMLDSGDFTTMSDLATAERVTPSYLARILRLTLLAPAIVEAILNGRQPASTTLDSLSRPFPLEWCAQIEVWGPVSEGKG